MKCQDAIIIGAGPAGLTAARRLIEGGYPGAVRVIEADGCVGGISRTIEYKGNRLDIGGHRFFTKSQTVSEIWHTVLSRESGELLLRPRRSHIYHRGKIFPYPLRASLSVLRNLGIGNALSACRDYLMARLHPRRELTLEDFYINRFGRELYERFFEDYTCKVWGVHPRDLGADWGAQRVKGLSVASLLKDTLFSALGIKGGRKETSLIEQFEYPRLGPGQMWERMSDEIVRGGGEIMLDTRAETVNIGADGGIESVTVLTAGGERRTLPCACVFSSMPLRELTASIRGLEVPQQVADIARGLPYRDFITAGLLVRKLRLERTDDTWIYIQEPGVKVGRLQIINNWSPAMVARPDDTVWIAAEYFCNEGDELWSATETDFIAMVTDEMLRIGVIVSASDVLDAVEVKMPKAYPAYFGTYDRLGELRDWLDAIPGLYCIGRNGQHRYNNMDHSMLTAVLAADIALGRGGSRSDVWNVNTEQDYHES